MAQIVCPHCFEQHPLKRLNMHCPVECGREGDTFSAAERCPHGNKPMTSRWCPKCKTVLEYDYLHTQGSTVALIGAGSAGKSTYFGVLVNELRHRVGDDFHGMSAEFVGDLSRRRYEETFAQPLYREGEAPEMTRESRSAAPAPVLVALKFPQQGRGVFGRDRVKPAMLTFFDTAGEDVRDATEMQRLARYLTSARGIILVVDPLQVPSVGRSIPADVPDNPVVEQSRVVTQLAARLREERRLSPSKRLDVPLAIALSKTDAVGSTFGDHSPLRRHHQHAGAYDESDGRHVHDEVRAWLHRWYGPEFDNIVANNFSRYRYFGFSALGAQPRGRKLVGSGVHPLRVEDPLLWLLAQFHLIDTARS
ncbi:TRAFAC clade GTPase domain-containing protein [Kineococcus sp. SYSU DK005]|uniref:TRAFAC clade GTPase domain-containing protein n=1 Tax=Kineococcus sp. SYSU DK005 TaxID=3383126 RepID=UPI003D7E206B